MLWRTVGVLMALLATDARAGPSALTGDQIKQMVAGAVFEVDTPLGTKLPISYSQDGRMSAEAGALAYLLGSPADSGNWWISGHRLCQKWRHWFDGAVHCLRLSQDGARILWRRDDGESGTASIASRPERQFALQEPPRQQQARTYEARAFVAPRSLARPAAPASPAGPLSPEPELADEPQSAQPPLEPGRAEPPNALAEPRSSLTTAPSAAKRPVAARASPAAPPVVVPRSPPSFRVAGVELDDVLNVRDGPSAEHDVIGSILPDAAGIKIVGPCVSAWCPIEHRGLSGWVNSLYLSPNER
jgi:Bacterial SH3 domain